MRWRTSGIATEMTRGGAFSSGGASAAPSPSHTLEVGTGREGAIGDEHRGTDASPADPLGELELTTGETGDLVRRDRTERVFEGVRG